VKILKKAKLNAKLMHLNNQKWKETCVVVRHYMSKGRNDAESTPKLIQIICTKEPSKLLS